MTLTNPVQRLLDWKLRGVRWIEIIGVVCVAAMVFSVYVAKAAAGRQGARIAEIERQISDDRHRVRLLRAEAARLEQPARLGALSRGAGLLPVTPVQQVSAGSLAALVPRPEVIPTVIAPPVPATVGVDEAMVEDAPPLAATQIASVEGAPR